MSEPDVGSVTPKACSRSSPDAIAGSQRAFCAGAAVPQQRAHGVHLGVAGRAVAARRLDLLHDRRRGRHAQSAAAVFFRDQRGEKTSLRERRDEFGRIGTLAVERAPVFAGEFGAKRANGLADLREILVRGTALGLGHGFQTALTIVSHRRGCRRTSGPPHPRARAYTGSHENTSLERSSGVNEGPSAPLSCWAMCSGVQPSERWMLRTTRG